MKSTIIAALSITALCFGKVVSTENNEMDKESLGKLLFSDPILSKDYTISCASCHKPEFAFADTSAVSLGVGGKKGARNTPTAMNLSLSKSFFWDGRAATLEEQVLKPIENPDEMDLSVAVAIERLSNNSLYRDYFKKVFNAAPTKENLAGAIAAFERTLETSDSPFDNWKFSDDSLAVSAEARAGFVVFNGKGNCVKCHFGADLTANEFRNIGLFNAKNLRDSGRAVISGNASDIGKFKTSSLRNVAITAPYMHNGMFKTLEEVVDFYNDTKQFVADAVNKDSLLMEPLGLTAKEKSDLVAFLRSLTDKRFSL
ncbi:MAG: cytochrome-c peroxidase [Chitinophagaceae bacterium]|nr:cytochrome-c peroxidase [Chitinophagaceae bacterium]